MFTLIQDRHATITLNCLPADERNNEPNRPLPYIEIAAAAGDQPKFRLQPVPVGKASLRLLLDTYYANCRIRATDLAQVPHLPEFVALPDRLKALQVPLGSDPLLAVAGVMGCGRDEVLVRIREAKWWLDHCLWNEQPARTFRAAYKAVTGLLQFTDIQLPGDEPADESWGRPDGDIGMTLWEFAGCYTDRIGNAMRGFLNNRPMEVVLEKWVDPRGDDDFYGPWFAQWSDTYGAMWGPFER